MSPKRPGPALEYSFVGRATLYRRRPAVSVLKILLVIRSLAVPLPIADRATAGRYIRKARFLAHNNSLNPCIYPEQKIGLPQSSDL